MIVRSIASRRLMCPSTMLRQVGALASSKSAMNPSAPEFSALIVNLAVGGPGDLDPPLLHVRGRSARPSSPRRGSRWVSARKSSDPPRPPSRSRRRPRAPAAARARRGPNSRCELGDELERVGGQDLFEAGLDRSAQLKPGVILAILSRRARPRGPRRRAPGDAAGVAGSRACRGGGELRRALGGCADEDSHAGVTRAALVLCPVGGPGRSRAAAADSRRAAHDARSRPTRARRRC